MNKITLIALLATSIITANYFCKAQCHIDDWTALKALYESTDGGNWTKNTNWYKIIYATDPSDCSLDNVYGLEVNHEGRVIKLALYNNQLSGFITTEIEKLTYLKELHLFENDLSGVIPSSMGNLSSLTKLNLYNNQLTGNIPPEIGNLSNLEALGLGINQLGGTLPVEIGNLTNLNWLDLSINQFTGTIPVEFNNLTKLDGLDLSYNKFQGTIPVEFENLKELYYLFLHSNELSGSLPSVLFSLLNMETLSLFSNKFTGNIPPEIINLSKLKSFNFNSNQLTGNIPSELGNLTNLREIAFASNQLTGKLPAAFGSLNKLNYLKVNNNKLSGCYLEELSQLCSRLTNLAFNGNVDISDDNNFEASWESFCASGAGTCLPVDEIKLSLLTNYSNEVSIILNNRQSILKNSIATVYDYSTCPNYGNLENCNPVTGVNNLSANEALWTVTKAAEYFSTFHNITISPINIVVNNTEHPNNAKYNPTYNTIVLGNGDGIKRNSISAPDIVGHEYAHAIINNINYLSFGSKIKSYLLYIFEK